MADPVPFREANLTLVAAPGDESSVRPLPVRRADGTIVSCWKLSAEDLEEIARTGVVWLSVWGEKTAPPVLVSGRKADVLD